MRKAIKPTQSANETRSRSGSDPCTSDGTPMTRSTVLPPHSSPLPLGHALDGAEHRADRYEPIATIVCAALSTALKQQLGRDALTADDARALRDAIARRDHNILALLVSVTAADAAPPAASPNNALTQRADREDVTAASVALLAAAPPAASPQGENALTQRADREDATTAPVVLVAPAPPAASSLLAAGNDGAWAGRTSYEQVDIACLLRNVMLSSGLVVVRMTRFDNNDDGLVQFCEIARIFGELQCRCVGAYEAT